MNPINLSDAQAVLLSTACAREDGLVLPSAAKFKGGAVGNVCRSLLKRGLAEEVPAKDPNPVWRRDEEAGPVALRATPLAYSALGIPAQDSRADYSEPGREAPSQAPVRRQRNGGKQAMLVEMLKAPEGATLQQMVEATGWQPHTVRGALAGALKKRLGLTVTSEKVEGCGRVYRVQD